MHFYGSGRERPDLEVSLKGNGQFWGPGQGPQFKGKFKGKLYILRPGPGEANLKVSLKENCKF